MSKQRKTKTTIPKKGPVLFRDISQPEWLKDTESRKLPAVIGRPMLIEKFDLREGTSKFKTLKRGEKAIYAIVRAAEWKKGKTGKPFRFSVSSKLVVGQLAKIDKTLKKTPVLATLEKLPHPSKKGHTYYTLR